MEVEKTWRDHPKGDPEAVVARRHHLELEELQAARKKVDDYREELTGRTQDNLRNMAGSGTKAGPYTLPHALVAMTGFSGSDGGAYNANMIIMVRACDSGDDAWASKVQAALNDPIAALPPEATGYAARVGYNDEISCTGWTHKTAYYNKAETSLHLVDE